MTEISLETRSALFAQSIQDTLDGSLPGGRLVVSVKAPTAPRFVVRLEDEKMPLFIAGEEIGHLSFAMDQEFDRARMFLKTSRSKIAVTAILDKAPLFRLEYSADSTRAPIAHWHVHAERGAMSYMLTRANQQSPRRISKPHDFSSLHFPVGGERFRPCLEDVVQFLIEEMGIDCLPGWRLAVESGRETWRRMQLRAAVRDAPNEAVSVLQSLDFEVRAPGEEPQNRVETLNRW